MPKPLTKLTWDNAALVGPETARRLKLANGDVIKIKLGERTVSAAVWLHPGQADGSIALTLGYGRTQAGHVGNGYGYNAYPLLPAHRPWFAADATLEKTSETYQLVATHEHWSMEGRELVRTVDFGKFAAESAELHEEAQKEEQQPDFFKPWPYPAQADNVPQYAWGMTIDQTACIGCNACIVACQAENNIPVVGKYQVSRGARCTGCGLIAITRGTTTKTPRPIFSPSPACTASRRRAKWSARWRPRYTTARG